MKTQKILFLEASGGGGHISITTSIIQALKKINPQIQTSRVDVMPPLAHKLYQLASRQFVNAYMFFYKATDNQRGEIIASRLNQIVNRKKLFNTIIENNPDIIFSNYSLCVDEVPKIIEKLKKPVPFIIFVPDPFTIHNTYFSKKADLTLVSTLSAYLAAIEKGLSPQKIRITGHPIREEFFNNNKNQKVIRKSLSLDPDSPTILFGGSGHGAEKSLEILIHLGSKPDVRLIKKLVKSANLDYKTYYKLFLKIYRQQSHKKLPHFNAIFVCGDNIELKEELQMLEFPDYITPRIFLHPNNMADLIYASDLIVGKAGPNILLESIMSEKPFLATYHIKGQEDGNISFIKSTQIGFVEENPQKTAQLIENFLHHPQILKLTHPSLKLIKQQHQDAATKIATLLNNFLHTS